MKKPIEERKMLKHQLRAYWSKKENDLLYWHPRQKCDSALLHHWLTSERIHITKLFMEDQIEFKDSFLDELDKRGFDIKTLKFSICYKKDVPCKP